MTARLSLLHSTSVGYFIGQLTLSSSVSLLYSLKRLRLKRRETGFGGVGRVDSTADDNFTRVANIHVEVTPHCSVAVGLQGDIIKYYSCIEFRFSSIPIQPTVGLFTYLSTRLRVNYGPSSIPISGYGI
jgi:hypothetical protein